ncbi:MAG: hypothetical protein HFE74_06610 [Firmicutes bacterium]|jgi:ribosomal protein L7Ae-like RNA K-turn-binding protein|nr:hypothetical protein [Bacillota bacterium]
MRDKVFRYIGLAARGRMVAIGYNTCVFSMSKSKVKLIILAEDLSQNSVEKIKSEADRKGIPVRVYGNKQELSHMTGKENSGIFGITDANLSKAILEEIDHMQSV